MTKTSNHRLYKHIKESFGYEKYLNVCPMSLRIPLTKLRLSSHLFNVERGRWGSRKCNVNERKCRLCDVVEDEYHCIIECPMYVKERRGCMPACLRNGPSMMKFIVFLKSEKWTDCIHAGLLCKRVMNEHKKYI